MFRQLVAVLLPCLVLGAEYPGFDQLADFAKSTVLAPIKARALTQRMRPDAEPATKSVLDICVRLVDSHNYEKSGANRTWASNVSMTMSNAEFLNIPNDDPKAPFVSVYDCQNAVRLLYRHSRKDWWNKYAGIHTGTM